MDIAFLRRVLIVLLAGGAVALLYAHISRRELPAFDAGTLERVRGAFHVHSEASHDSDLTLDQIAAAAKRVGLQFVVVTDHDAQMAGAVTIDGVTILSSAELTTDFGHLIQLGAIDILPKSRRGDLSIYDSIGALGGVPIIAHPADAKRPWEGPLADAGGVEIANLASSARRRGGPVFAGLLPALAVWRLRPELALAQVYDRDVGALRRWDGESDPGYVGICAGDAHGRIPLWRNLAAWQIALDITLPAEEGRRPAAIVDGIAAGRFHCTAGLLDNTPQFEFYGRLIGDQIAHPGDNTTTNEIDDLVVAGPTTTGDPPRIVLLRNGEEIVRTRGSHLVYTHPGPGTYRVEIHVRLPGVFYGDRVVPVLYSNRIRVEEPPAQSADPPLPIPR